MISRFARGTLPARPISRSPLGLVLAAVLTFAVATFAQSLYLPTGGPDGIALLPPPPAPHSSEEAAELACVRSVFNARTPAEEAVGETAQPATDTRIEATHAARRLTQLAAGDSGRLRRLLQKN